MIDLDDVGGRIRTVIERVGADLKPDEDWLPILAVFREEEGELIHSFAAIPQIGDPDFKELICSAMIPQFIAEMRGQVAALHVMGWQRVIGGGVEEAAQRASREAATGSDKAEVLTVFICSKTDERMFMAYVHRSKDGPPTLQWESKVPDRVEGRFVNALRAGLAHKQIGRG